MLIKKGLIKDVAQAIQNQKLHQELLQFRVYHKDIVGRCQLYWSSFAGEINLKIGRRNVI